MIHVEHPSDGEDVTVTGHHLHVDGEQFVVSTRLGGLDFTWVSGPHDPPYGFSRGSSQGMGEAEMRAAIARFLADINPQTGYLD